MPAIPQLARPEYRECKPNGTMRAKLRSHKWGLMCFSNSKGPWRETEVEEDADEASTSRKIDSPPKVHVWEQVEVSVLEKLSHLGRTSLHRARGPSDPLQSSGRQTGIPRNHRGAWISGGLNEIMHAERINRYEISPKSCGSTAFSGTARSRIY